MKVFIEWGCNICTFTGILPVWYLVTGGNWPNTVALWMIDSLTWTGCTGTDGECISSAEVSW